MAVADYLDRAALAASQALGGLAPDAFREQLERTPFELVFGQRALATHEGRIALDLAVRLLARLYPVLDLVGPPGRIRDELRDLARRINPRIELASDSPAVAMVIGPDAATPRASAVYVGSDAWIGRTSRERPLGLSSSAQPFGSAAAVCLAVARIFRLVFVPSADGRDDEEINVQMALTGSSARLPDNIDVGELPLLGVGAVGEAALWTLLRAPLKGRIHLVDDQTIELSNIQRYLLTERADEHEVKVGLGAAAGFGLSLELVPHRQSWQDFTREHGTNWDKVVVALDTTLGRREVQATLPRWLGNAWTQVGDLGVSTHVFGAGPCGWCLYLPAGEVPSEDEVIAVALKVPHAEVKFLFRDLLYTGAPVPEEALQKIGEALGVEPDRLEPYRGLPLRQLYQQGVCGGGLLPAPSDAPGELQVPLAHQSALAGVLLGASLVLEAAGIRRDTRELLRIDVMRPLGEHIVRPFERDSRGLCICRDEDFLLAYESKYGITDVTLGPSGEGSSLAIPEQRAPEHLGDEGQAAMPSVRGSVG